MPGDFSPPCPPVGPGPSVLPRPSYPIFRTNLKSQIPNFRFQIHPRSRVSHTRSNLSFRPISEGRIPHNRQRVPKPQRGDREIAQGKRSATLGHLPAVIRPLNGGREHRPHRPAPPPLSRSGKAAPIPLGESPPKNLCASAVRSPRHHHPNDSALRPAATASMLTTKP